MNDAFMHHTMHVLYAPEDGEGGRPDGEEDESG